MTSWRTHRRGLGAVLGAICGTVAGVAVPGRALADAAGPSDFRSEIVAVEPATPAIRVSVEGGDSFLRIEVEPGSEVVILGYDDEPAVLVDRDGRVFENRLSPSTYLNDDRYGTDEVPGFTDPDAPPDWVEVGGGGAWAWHDHRAHWMSTEPPVGMRPGDALPTQTIPMLVDGRDVSVTVVTTLVGGPSPWSTLAGFVAGVAVAVLGVRQRLVPAAALLLALAALAVGGAQFLSLPSETGPSPIWWLAPAIGVVSAGVAWCWRSPVVGDGLVALTGAQLVLWVVVRRETLVRPVLPTDAPFWLDRAVTAAAGAGGVVLVGAGLLGLVAAVRQPPRATSIAAFRSS